jgi:predicted Zn-dependent peptidase
MLKYHLTTFSNGLRVLSVPSKESLSFQVMVLVNTGSDFETKDINGLSHFLEHMCFKGTKKRPSNLIITSELDKVGGMYNAFTGREYTGYFARVAKEHKALAIDIISDIYLNPQFQEKEINKEKGVIIEEINMYHDDPKSHVDELWDKLLYGNQPAGWSVAGSKFNIKKIGRRDFVNYHKSQYRSKSSLIVVSGNFKEREVLSLLKESFKNIPRGKGRNKIRVKEKQRTPGILIEQRKIDQTHIVLGVRGINAFDKRRYTLHVLNSVLSGGMSSRLFQLVRGQLGAAYYIDSFDEYKTDTGYWAIVAGLDSKRVELVLRAIIKEWQSFKTSLVSPKDLKKTKDFIAGQIALRFEDVHSIASNYSSQLLLKNKIETPQEYLRKIKQVNSSDIRKVASELLRDERLNLALVGPYPNIKQLRKLLKI